MKINYLSDLLMLMLVIVTAIIYYNFDSRINDLEKQDKFLFYDATKMGR